MFLWIEEPCEYNLDELIQFLNLQYPDNYFLIDEGDQFKRDSSYFEEKSLSVMLMIGTL